MFGVRSIDLKQLCCDLLRLAACVSLFLLIDHGPTDFVPSPQPPSPQPAAKATVDCGEVSISCVHERLAAQPPGGSVPAGLFVLHAGEWPAHTAHFVQSVAAAAGTSGAFTTYFVSAARPPLSGCGATSCVWLPVSPEMLGLRVARMLGVPQNCLQRDAPVNASWVAAKLRDDLPIFAPSLFPSVAARHAWVGYIRPELRIHGNLSADIRALERGGGRHNALFHVDDARTGAHAGGAALGGPPGSSRPPPPSLQSSREPAAMPAKPARAARRGGPSDFWLVKNEPNLVESWRHSRMWRQVLQSCRPLGFNRAAARGDGGGDGGGSGGSGREEGGPMETQSVAGVVSRLVDAGRLHPKQLPDGRLRCCLGSSSPRRAARRGMPEGVQ